MVYTRLDGRPRKLNGFEMATTPSTTNAHSNPNENTHRWLSAIKPFCTKSSQDFDLDEKQEGKTPSYFSFNVSVMQGLTKFLAEVIGTGFLMFGGCMGCFSWDTQVPNIQCALSFGLTVMIIIQCYGHISGAHLNPAVTVAAVVFRSITIPMAIVYFFAQLIGAVLGYRLLKALTPDEVYEKSCGKYGFCATGPHESVSEFQAFFIEFIATTVLITVCCAVWDPRNAKHQDSVPLKFGSAITFLSFAFGPYTGCSMNPIRTFAPAFWNQNYVMHWVYWIGPMLSALLTSVSYKFLFFEKQESDFEIVRPLRHAELPKV